MFMKMRGILLCLVLLISILPSFVHAETEDNKQTQNTGIESRQEITEVESERDEYSKTFVDEVGQFTKEIYTDPIHTKIDGEWSEISTDISLDETEEQLKTETTQLEAAYPAEMSTNEDITYTFGKHALEFTNITASDGAKKFSLSPDATTKYEENKVLYDEVLPGIDLRHVSLNTEVKEDWIINDYQGIHQFNYEVSTDLIAHLEEDGSIGFYEDQEMKKKVFKLPSPVMEDSNIEPGLGSGVKSTDLHYELASISDSKYAIRLVVDKKWLEAEERVFPIYVDPSVTIDALGDSYVSSADSDSNFNKQWNSVYGEYVLKVGRYDTSTGTNYAYVKFTIIGTLKGAIIDSANLQTYVTHNYEETEKTGLWADRVNAAWATDTVTWNNKPSSTNIASTTVARNQWATFNVTKTIQEMADGNIENYGFKFHTNGNGQTYWKQLSAAENTNKTKIVVNYHYDAPAQSPTATGYSINKDTGYFDLTWKPVYGATGYKVAIFNGKDYQTVDVGNTTSWTSEGKKLWPTTADIAAGKYLLRMDGTGNELAVNPSKVYKNAFLAGGSTDHGARENYWFRIIALYPGGESPRSAAVAPYLPLGNPTITGTVASGLPYYRGGSVDLKWDSVQGADGYKVAVFNGKEYQEYDAGLSTEWTTSGKYLWPTKAEIEAGNYLLHHDEAGAELALDPSSVYVNSGGSYPTSKNYWFKVRAYNNSGHEDSGFSNFYKPTIPVRTFSDITLDKGKDFVDLKWSLVPSASKYEIIVDTLGEKTKVYSGSLPTFKHTNLISGTLYDYKIYAYDVNGKLVDIAKVSVFTKFDDGLDALNIDSIITSTKIKIKWNPLMNVEGYVVSKNGSFMHTMNVSEFVDTDFNIGDQFEYTINSVEKLGTDEESANLLHEDTVGADTSNVEVVDEPIIESDAPLEVLAELAEETPDTEQATPNEQSYVISIPVNTRLEDVATQSASLPSMTTIRHRVFLPPAYKKLSGLNYYYSGDNRMNSTKTKSTFSATAGTHRTRADVRVNWAKGKGCFSGQVTVGKSVYPSHEYKKVNGKLVLNDTRTAKTSGINLHCSYNTGSVAKYNLFHSVGIPFWGNTPPDIDYKYTEIVYRSGITMIQGWHDQFPAHEIYRNNSTSSTWKTLYRFDPIAEDTSIEYLWPYKLNRYINLEK